MSSSKIFRGSKTQRVGYAKLKEGDKERVHGKKIEHLITKHKDYIVYLDEELFVFWAYGKGTMKPDWWNKFGEIFNEVSHLEGISISGLSKKQKISYRRMIGEAIARAFDTQDPELSRQVLQKAATFIEARHAERARSWYLLSSLYYTIAVVGILWLIGNAYKVHGITSNIFLTVGAGSTGALLSILLRSHTVPLDISTAENLYRLEAIAKITAGMIGALLIYLGISAKIIFGSVVDIQSSISLILTLGIIAGASERLVPSIIAQVENSEMKHVQKVTNAP